MDLEYAGDTMNSFETTACRVLGSCKSRPLEMLISGALAAMEDRARDISEFEYMEPLWNYFNENGLLQ